MESRIRHMLETSARLLKLLSLLQVRRDWTGPELADRLSVDVRIDPGAVKFAREGAAYVAKVEALHFCADGRERLVGENWQTLDFRLTEENYQKFMREGVGYTVHVPVDGDPAYLKVILYDHAADLVGSAMVRLKKQ